MTAGRKHGEGGSGRVGSRQEREGTLPADSAGNTLGTTLKHTEKNGKTHGLQPEMGAATRAEHLRSGRRGSGRHGRSGGP